jgi:hypothetical protein
MSLTWLEGEMEFTPLGTDKEKLEPIGVESQCKRTTTYTNLETNPAII